MTGERPWIRSFVIDGEETTERTYRLGLVEHYTEIRGRTFVDLGAGDGYEARAVAHRGAKRAVAVEGKEGPFEAARAAQEHLRLPNHEVLRLDVRRIDAHGLGTFDVVLCFGLLYHMTNPFNLLKRIRNVTGELLLLETHVAPRTMRGLLRKHVMYLPFGIHEVELDGVPFEGKIVRHAGDFARSRGSLDEPWTLWLTQESLLKALVRAGFAVLDYHHELDAACPEPVRRWGELLGFGHANTKVWAVATPRERGYREAGEPTERILRGQPGPGDGLLERVRRRALLARSG